MFSPWAPPRRLASLSSPLGPERISPGWMWELLRFTAAKLASWELGPASWARDQLAAVNQVSQADKSVGYSLNQIQRICKSGSTGQHASRLNIEVRARRGGACL